jgi:hypothetical protein
MYRWLAFAVVGLALLATAYWAYFGGGLVGEEAVPEGARVEEREGITIVRLAGPPRSKGRALGRALEARIRAELERALPADPGLREFVVRTCGERLAAFLPPEYREEIEGIAEGAGIAFEEVLLLNTRYELAGHGLAREEGDLAGPGAVGPGPEAGRLFADGAVGELVVVIHDDEDPPLALVARPGMAGGFLGARGDIAAAIKPMQSQTPPDLGGLVWTLLLRRLLEAPRAPPAHVTGPVSVAMAVPDGAGTLNLAVWGATWYAAGGSRSLTTEEPVRGTKGGAALSVQRDPEERPRVAAAAEGLLGDPPPAGRTLLCLRAGAGLRLLLWGPGGRREVRLAPE